MSVATDHLGGDDALHRRDHAFSGGKSCQLPLAERRRQKDVALLIGGKSVQNGDVRDDRTDSADLLATAEGIGNKAEARIFLHRAVPPRSRECKGEAVSA